METSATITGPTAFITAVLAVLILVVPRRYLLVPIIVAACFVPCEQHVFLLRGHFYVQRIIIIAGIVRIFVRGEARRIRWNRFDKIILAWVLVGAVVYILRRLDGQSLIYKSGVLLSMLGMYWLVRQNIASWEDMKAVWRIFAYCALALVPLVAVEWTTGNSPFQLLGRAHTEWRAGEWRAAASLPHPILAGAFWVPLVPIFTALGLVDRRKLLYWCAFAASIFIVIASRSSTPIGGLGAVLLFTLLYQYRHYGRHMAVMFFGSLLALHVVMAAPVWHLLCRIRIFSGTTGYHRYALIQRTIEHFREWAMLGTISTWHWGYGMFDITNQFCLEGIRGGLITLVLFIAILFVGIRATGAYSQRRVGRDRQWLSWALCCSLIGHCIMFIGVSYFGQIHMLLALTFALTGFMYEQNAAAKAPIRHPAPSGHTVGPKHHGMALAR